MFRIPWFSKKECEAPKKIRWDRKFCDAGAARHGSYSAFFLTKTNEEWAEGNLTWDGLIRLVLGLSRETAKRNVKDDNDEGTESDT